ncbi:MAG: hypothetical protein HRU17_19565 [Polyangiaceae bacterium]|nr:hypothetical protein [Polyangiaceae bacterium]
MFFEHLAPLSRSRFCWALGARWERLFLVDGHMGLGTPGGTGGLQLEFAPLPYLGFAIGGGAGVHGPQAAVHARARMPVQGSSAFAFGVGGSHGKYLPFEVFGTSGLKPALTTWLNATFAMNFAARAARTSGATSARAVLPLGTSCTAV